MRHEKSIGGTWTRLARRVPYQCRHPAALASVHYSLHRFILAVRFREEPSKPSDALRPAPPPVTESIQSCRPTHAGSPPPTRPAQNQRGHALVRSRFDFRAEWPIRDPSYSRRDADRRCGPHRHPEAPRVTPFTPPDCLSPLEESYARHASGEAADALRHGSACLLDPVEQPSRPRILTPARQVTASCPKKRKPPRRACHDCFRPRTRCVNQNSFGPLEAGWVRTLGGAR